MFTLGIRTSYVHPEGSQAGGECGHRVPFNTLASELHRHGPRALRAGRGKGFVLQHLPIGPLRRFWALGEERIILASALMRHLRKRINAQRLRLSTCKAGALPTELRPHVLLRSDVFLCVAKLRRPGGTSQPAPFWLNSIAQRT